MPNEYDTGNNKSRQTVARTIISVAGALLFIAITNAAEVRHSVLAIEREHARPFVANGKYSRLTTAFNFGTHPCLITKRKIRSNSSVEKERAWVGGAVLKNSRIERFRFIYFLFVCDFECVRSNAPEEVIRKRTFFFLDSLRVLRLVFAGQLKFEHEIAVGSAGRGKRRRRRYNVGLRGW